ncbi:hypothetical protein B4U79_09066 [Dinothrombium tinctorium]|uniref:Retinol dehydrogenase 12-like protein n=1 Tax=Dinothrombium tinctorium TaxID=1965070 RepID=A0A443R7Q7_9ACAR|nr:hypothetical protein B4U79_09066 [Dinothrombium tinctorium]
MLRGSAYFQSSCPSNNRIYGKTVIITGGNTGIGKEIAIDLASRGGRIIVVCRNPEKALMAVKEIKEESGSSNVYSYSMDLSSLQSIRVTAAKILEKETRIDILINNAGVMMGSYAKTVDGFESHFGVNYLGHFLFTLLLLNKMKESPNARIINVSSSKHEEGKIDFDDLNLERSYSPFIAYANSKLALILFTRELSNRLKGSSVRVYSTSPSIPTSNSPRMYSILENMVSCSGLSARRAARSQVHCAVDSDAGKYSGLHFVDCKPTIPADQALDDESAKRLWDISLNLVELCDIRQRAKNCALDKRLDGKTVIITGGNSGIGKETAIDLARRGRFSISLEIKFKIIQFEIIGARVLICCRNEEKALNAIDVIKRNSNSDNVQYYLMDLASFRSIRHAAAIILENELNIDILINNAAVMMCPFELTVDGYELQFATNHLGTGINVYSLHPGIVQTELVKSIESCVQRFLINSITRLFGKSATQGAQTHIYCAVNKEIGTETGFYYVNCEKVEPSKQAIDEDTAKKLWQVSLEMVGLVDYCDI